MLGGQKRAHRPLQLRSRWPRPAAPPSSLGERGVLPRVGWNICRPDAVRPLVPRLTRCLLRIGNVYAVRAPGRAIYIDAAITIPAEGA